jgi:signal transduction histidine kinase
LSFSLESVLSEWRLGDYKQRLKESGSLEFRALSGQMNALAAQVDSHLSAQRELMVAVSHELRSPLARVQVAAEMVSDPQIKSSIQEEVRLMDRFTGLLLERERLSKTPEALERKVVSVRHWIETALELVGPKRASVEIQIPDAVMDLTGNWDERRLVLVLHGILENALKYSGKDWVRVSARADDHELRLQIEDQGPGFPEEVISRLGQPLVKGSRERGTNRTEQGFGMGLSLAVAILSAHRGRVHLENRHPGASVEIILPRGSSSGPPRA